MQPTVLLWIALAAIALASPAAATSDHRFSTIYSFEGQGFAHDGSYPTALIADSSGTIYGITEEGGWAYGTCGAGCGTLFKIEPDGKKRTLRTFSPVTGTPSPGLALDGAGNLFWTTADGGQGNKTCRYGCGTVYEYGPSGKRVLYEFENMKLGFGPSSGVILDGSGNLYGTTRYAATVFMITGRHHGTALHLLRAEDDSTPNGLVMDDESNLYGTTQGGVVFKLTLNRQWTVLHRFRQKNDGRDPRAGLTLDASGSLYGTTYSGGQYNKGTIYEIDPDGNETVLHSFGGAPDDGSRPEAALLQDSHGNLYGTTRDGGASNKGTVFKLAPDGEETLLHSFRGRDGVSPVASLIFLDEYLYGTTAEGGNNKDCGPDGCGTVFRLKP